MPDVDVTGLFPTPFMNVGGMLDPSSVAGLIEEFDACSTSTNVNSTQLSHSSVMDPESSQSFRDIATAVTPLLVRFGELLFGEELDWLVKEMWLNRLETGGHQSVHSHANSFISGVIYLTPTHASARTVFYRGMGGHEFAFANVHAGTRMGPFNAPKWAVPGPNPGDMVLFPSFLLHEVPKNEGDTRMTLAFNAVPTRLRSWDYELKLSSGRA